MKKIGKMNEAAYVLGILLCALGVALCTKANFGLSMIAAPSYIFSTTLSKYLPWLTQGTAEYLWQGLQLVILCIIIRRFRLKYLLSFVTAMIFGLTLDTWLWVFGGNGAYSEIYMRVIALILGELITALSIAFFFRTSLPLQICELIVVEISDRFGFDTNSVKHVTDILLFVLSLALSFALAGGLCGIGVGTVVIVLVNAPLIKLFGKLLDKIFVFDSLFARKNK